MGIVNECYHQADAGGTILLCPAVTTRGRSFLQVYLHQRVKESRCHGNLNAMTESVLIALYRNATSLNLTCKKLKVVPTCVSTIANLSVLLLNNNSICALPAELRALRHVSAHPADGHVPRQRSMFYTPCRFVMKYFSFSMPASSLS